jgi:hypothetical protein
VPIRVAPDKKSTRVIVPPVIVASADKTKLEGALKTVPGKGLVMITATSGGPALAKIGLLVVMR